MFKYFLICFLFIAPQAFADMQYDHKPIKQCENIAKACSDAGFTRRGAAGKQFWHDCMKPILFGKTVSGVTVAAGDAQACRQGKIQHLRTKLDELQKMQNSPQQ